jgi:hypothetical protein
MLMYLASRVLSNGLILTVIPLTFGRARLGISRDWNTYDRVY